MQGLDRGDRGSDSVDDRDVESSSDGRLEAGHAGAAEADHFGAAIDESARGLDECGGCALGFGFQLEHAESGSGDTGTVGEQRISR